MRGFWLVTQKSSYRLIMVREANSLRAEAKIALFDYGRLHLRTTTYQRSGAALLSAKVMQKA
jgi:hypothetical protein